MRERFPHTFDHRGCPACEHARRAQAGPLDGRLLFTEAARRWIARRELGAGEQARYISPRRAADLKRYAAAAGKFLGRLRLEEIHLGHLHEYQRARAAGDSGAAAWRRAAGANVIRKEMQVVVAILDAAGLWPEERERRFQRVQAEERDVRRAMTPEEQRRLLAAALEREEWRVVHWYAVLALQTTAATNELRGLRLDDVELGAAASIRVRGKNRHRNRTIPVVSEAARGAVGGLMTRARRLGAKDGSDFLFPLHVTADRYDAARPMTVAGLRKRWEAVRAAAGLPWLRMYDLRHAGLTRMAEAGAPVHVMMAFAGHMSLRMQRHYIAIGMAAKTDWARTVWGAAGTDNYPIISGSKRAELPPKKAPGSVTFPERINTVNG